MKATVYGIPNCSSVKKALDSLKSQGFEIVFHDFKKQGVSNELLEQWLAAFGLEKLLNSRGTTWRNLNSALQEQAQTPEGAKALMMQYPSTIKRPVVEIQGRLSIGQTDFAQQSQGEAT